MSELWVRIAAWVRSESLLLAVLGGSFLARFLVADRNSYWLDELLSVNVYGQWHDSAIQAVRHLAEHSIHPPLYQFTLYNWMSLFGNSELATRSLSNLYVTLAGLFLYLLVRDLFPRRVALGTVVAFSLMYTPVYYALETRSYAQTIFLVTLSSYLLLRIVHNSATRGWRLALISPIGSLFIATNVALLLTHYYNAFFWTTQTVVAGAFVLREQPIKRWLTGAGVLVGLYGAQLAISVGVWGRVFLNDFGRRAGDFAVEGADDLRDPFDVLLNSVITPNIDPPRLIAWVGVAIASVMLIRALLILTRRAELNRERCRAWLVVYLSAWLILPLVVVFITFSTLGVARYNARFFLFSTVPIAPLLVLTIEQAYRLLSSGLRWVRGTSLPMGWSGVLAAVVIGALVAPGAQAAATEPKHDWRGIVQQVTHVVTQDPDHSYVIFETAHRRRPMTDFYFERFSRDVRPYDTLQRYEERQGEYRILSVDEPVIMEHDYLVLLFTHSRTSNFPNALKALEERYQVHHRQLNHVGRGFIVYKVHPDNEPEMAGVRS